jgi:transposase
MVRLWLDGYSYDEIAKRLEVSPIDVGNGLRRFKERARRLSSSTQWEEGQ